MERMAIQRLNVEANKQVKSISIEETKQETNVWTVLNVLVQFVRTN
jgi:hypothetical protein